MRRTPAIGRRDPPELVDVDRALAYAAGLVPAMLPAAERRTRAATDTARALVAVGDVPATSVQLQLVERTAPRRSLICWRRLNRPKSW